MKKKKKITGMELLNLSMEVEYGCMSWVVWKLWEYGSLVLV